jgi:hypothetical protein
VGLRRFARIFAFSPLHLIAVMLPMAAGCSINRYQPGHFRFVTVVEQTEPGAGGWRAACITCGRHQQNHASNDPVRQENNTHES